MRVILPFLAIGFVLLQAGCSTGSVTTPPQEAPTLTVDNRTSNILWVTVNNWLLGGIAAEESETWPVDIDEHTLLITASYEPPKYGNIEKDVANCKDYPRIVKFLSDYNHIIEVHEDDLPPHRVWIRNNTFETLYVLCHDNENEYVHTVDGWNHDLDFIIDPFWKYYIDITVQTTEGEKHVIGFPKIDVLGLNGVRSIYSIEDEDIPG